ncbi:type III secretion system export apparatus subunit SctU [Pseudomonas plecoglossicida]|uniref:EscU/YscU/HrcU family type III secretion system export apparatus switch protein n=1 Tax=Pseudomonas plecoglossicida TaxID=70775 RepID=A0AAD0VSY6_PSEDL|nr:type III secretion system export apparatus subunit SctU [Pseudomonas plecoglossicida]AXM95550.1 EscU/YscU/HrcU family type III secretion system export apparatus switch protein [Pseudomonas plecoglossicida]EPB94355.1 Type III secretion component protein SctU [Pseudomonas plecoglossicida NB2011]QLB56297.1 type III secretion system export apparatus subunit SctU [Pseudomonas plecoglossicida]GLR37908.1 EscU/YscU/HrcU family type III secretion system export apparatus switch protein [Pseudomonas pl
MSEQKTEKPTQKKIRDARKRGQVVKSKEVVSTFLILSLAALLTGYSAFFLEHMKAILLLPENFIHLPFMQALTSMAEQLLIEMLLISLPIFGVAALSIIVAHVLQFGVLLSGESIKPDIKKINPIEGAKKIFSLKSLIEFFKSIIKVSLLTTLVWLTLESHLKSLMMLATCGIACVSPILGLMLQQMLLLCAGGLIIISAADYAFERYQHLRELRMGKDEVKREHKENEGSPQLKQKRRQFHKDLQNNSLRNDVKRSSVIVVNPTHIAVGIHYARGETPLPIITLKQSNEQALVVRKMAEEEGVAVVERIPLARALYKDGRLDQYIPSELIKTTAEVLRWLEEQNNQT